eukprot:216941-Rhodomonas_salina.1
MVLRACYAISSTSYALSCYGLSGTDLGYAATEHARCPEREALRGGGGGGGGGEGGGREGREGEERVRFPMCIRLCYAVGGTELAYGAMWCA